MALSDPNHTPDPRPTGDLEQLFRQKFAEAEVQPRASLWEQLDHELLVQQNETYRRRLLGYRWAAAASLLLLAGGGTWLSLQPNAATVATAPGQPAAAGSRAAAAAEGSASPAAAVGRTYVLAGRSQSGQPLAATQSAAGSAAGLPIAGAAGGADEYAGLKDGRAESGYSYTAALSGRGAAATTGRSLGLNDGQRNAGSLGSVLLQDGYSLAAAPAPASTWAADGSAQSLTGRAASLANDAAAFGRPELLAAVPATPALLVAQASPAAATAEEPTQEAAPAKSRRWKFNTSYAAGAFNPNADFTRVASSGNTYASVAAMRTANDAYEVAASEYRDKLQAGVSQQAAVLADYALNEQWSVGAGLALSQQEATSATSWNFLDGKSATVAAYDATTSGNGSYMRPAPAAPLRNVRYRYRTAGVPVQVRYTTNAKQGWALYAKLGAAVSVLLGSRTELEGVPEATRTYTLASADSPYRKVLASLHGGTGVRFQPAKASWSMAIGPKAEAGLTTLNNSPAASLLRRRRPYTVGLEASVEFGNLKSTPVARR